jgi:hypothetical protein
MSPTIIECGSGIERVTVYARGAVVTRRVTLPSELPEGRVELRVGGITALADAGSVRAICEGDREVTAISARLALPAPDARRGSLAERLRAIDLDRASLDAERASLVELRAGLADLGLDPGLSRWAKRLDPAARFADAAALHGLVGAEIARVDGAILDLDARIADLVRAREAAQIEAAQATPDATDGEDRARLDVLVRLAAGEGRVGALAIEYVVGAARWWPAYSARFTDAATKVALTLDALVAQSTGEDWSRVRLALSTAHLAHDARLPELSSLRLGRAQPAPKRGYREAPEGLAALFDGYDRAMAQVRGPASLGDQGVTLTDVLSDSDEGDFDAPAEPAPAEIALAAKALTRTGMIAGDWEGAAAMAMPAGAAGVSLGEKRKVEQLREESIGPARPMAPPMRKSAGLFSSFGGGGGGSYDDDGLELQQSLRSKRGSGNMPFATAQPTAIEPADAWRDFDALVLATPEDIETRGRLVRDPGLFGGSRAERARARVDAIADPPLARDPLASRGRYDHRYDADAAADVPSNGIPHRVAIGAADAGASPCFLAVPREAAEVYREAEIKNPFDAPLLAGPVDVFMDGALMTTSQMTHVDRHGSMRIGLGVEDRLRVARNARVDESTAGLLGGSLVVDHAVTIDLSSSLGRDVKVDVIDRIPLSDEKDVDVKLTYTHPDHQKYTQAERGSPVRRAIRFTALVPAGGKAKIEIGYRVTLPAKNEIVGGNRRD